MDDLLTMNSGLALGLVGWLGYALRSIPSAIWMFMRQRVCVTIESDTGEIDIYGAIIKWILSKHPEIADHMFHFNQWKRRQMSLERLGGIANGVYYYKLPGFNLMVVYASQINTNFSERITRTITVDIFGPDRKQFLEDYNEFSNTLLYEKQNSFLNLSVGRSGLLVPMRSFDNVFCPHKDEIVQIVTRFLESEKEYKDHGVVYKTGFLFYGPPGSGKSSLARAIASYVKWPIVFINLKTMSLDDDFYIDPFRVYLLEDVDCLTVSREETDKEKKKEGEAALHTILNVLDGIISPSHCIFIATTNYIDKVDPALVRQGRFDHVYEIPLMTKETAREMCDSYGVDQKILDEYEFPISGAVIQNRILYDKIRGNSNED